MLTISSQKTSTKKLQTLVKQKDNSPERNMKTSSNGFSKQESHPTSHKILKLLKPWLVSSQACNKKLILLKENVNQNGFG